jgi:hypothetical protein
MIDSRGEVGQKRSSRKEAALAQKLDRKQLKKPDEFQVIATKVMDWIVAHQKPILVGLAVVAVAIVAGWAFTSYSSSREGRAGGELASALEVESRPLASEGPSQPGIPSFATREERTKAALAALDRVRSDYPRSVAAQTALAEIGFLKLKEGDAAGAQTALQQFAKEAGQDHPLRAVAQESLGYAFEAQGKLDDARSAFAQLAQDGAPARAAYQQARIALVEGKPDARQQLQQVAKDYAKEPIAQEANMRVSLATLPPPAAPAPAPAHPTKKPAATANKGKK